MKTFLLIIMMSSSSSNELNPVNVYQYCVQQEVKHPEIVTAQAIWETGWFKCNNCSLDKNNLFGFNTGGPYFKYDSWKESVDAYKRWQDNYYDPNRDYYEFLACIYEDRNGRCLKYCTDPTTYTACLKSTIRIHLEKWQNN